MLVKLNNEHYTLTKGKIVFNIKYDRVHQEWQAKIGKGKIVNRSFNQLVRNLPYENNLAS